MEIVYWRGRAKAHFVVAGIVGGAGVALSYGIGDGVLTLDPHLPLALILLSLARAVLGLRAMQKGSVIPGDVVDAFREAWGKWHYLSMRLSQSSGRAARERAYLTRSRDCRANGWQDVTYRCGSPVDVQRAVGDLDRLEGRMGSPEDHLSPGAMPVGHLS